MKNLSLATADAWLGSVAGQPGPKFITGLRGIGKSACLDRIDRKLASNGVPAKNRLMIDTADPKWRRYTTCEQMIDFIARTLPSKEKSYVLIKEAAALRDAEVVIGTLAASDRYEVFATSSSRRLLGEGLAGYFGDRILHLELLPEERRAEYPLVEARARWNEIFLYDVISPSSILEPHLLHRTAEWMSDHLGETTSLRILAEAVSPTKRLLSPHTIERYLDALETAHLVERCCRYYPEDGVVSSRKYKYFFTDPFLRLAHFGAAPENEARRMALNRAWLHLRHLGAQVYCTEDASELDFVSIAAHGERAGWRLDDTGKLRQVMI